MPLGGKQEKRRLRGASPNQIKVIYQKLGEKRLNKNRRKWGLFEERRRKGSLKKEEDNKPFRE